MSIIDFIVVLQIFGRIKVIMAKMIPHNLPKTSRSNAEKILFDIFAKELSDDATHQKQSQKSNPLIANTSSPPNSTNSDRE